MSFANDVTIRFDDVTLAEVTTGIPNAASETVTQNTAACLLYQLIWYTVICGCICVAGVIGNVTSFIVFQRDSLKTSTSFLFQSLAVVDTFMLLLIIPTYSLTPLMNYLGVNDFRYYVFPYIAVYVLPFAYLAQSCAVWVTVLVGAIRYIAVCHPYKAPTWCSVTRAKHLLAIVILSSFVYNLPSFATKRIRFEYLEALNSSVPVPHSTMPNLFEIVYYNFCYSIFMLIIPLTALIVLSVLLIRKMKGVAKRRKSMVTSDRHDSSITFTLVTVLIVFAICQAPALFTQILWSVLSDSHRDCGGFQFYWSPISNSLVVLNSAINFTLYVTTNIRFRNTLRTELLKLPAESARPRPHNNHQNGATQTDTLLTQL